MENVVNANIQTPSSITYAYHMAGNLGDLLLNSQFTAFLRVSQLKHGVEMTVTQSIRFLSFGFLSMTVNLRE